MTYINDILIVDDEIDFGEMLKFALKRKGFNVVVKTNPVEALNFLKKNVFDLIICDVSMPEMDGIEFLERFKKLKVETPVIMISAYGTIDTAVLAMKKGAYHYIKKPFNPDELFVLIDRLEEKKKLESKVRLLETREDEKYDFSNIIGQSEAIAKLLKNVKKVLNYKSSVLITGESGTGKELIARAIHYNSNRKDGPFIAVNCGAIPENLLESEFFGHVKGAFTGAIKSKPGLFEEACGGTLFLDEIGELPVNMQVKFLRALQNEEIRRVGDTASRKIDVRIISATSKNLLEEIRNKRFREDLYYRLNVINLHIPPLRERVEDIPLLVDHFIKKYREKYKKTNPELNIKAKRVSPDVLKIFMEYPWPGNVRELENTIERALILSEGEVITEAMLPDKFFYPINPIKLAVESKEFSLKKAVKVVEKELIIRALKRTGGVKTKAAKLLEISHKALLYKIKEYNINLKDIHD